MAFLFADSFDHLATADILQKWTQALVGGGGGLAPTINSTAGRRGGNGVSLAVASSGSASKSQSLAITLAPGDGTAIIGFSFATTTLARLGVSTAEATSNNICRIRDAGTTQVWFRLNADGTISALRSTTILGTTTFALSVGTTYYLEFKVTVHSTAGIVVVRVDGDTKLSLPVSGSLNTENTTNASWNELVLGGGAFSTSADAFYYDDLYCLDGSGATTASKNFLGDVRIDAVYPNAVGNTSNWARSTGADQWATIDEATSNGDTDYNSSATVNDKDTLNFPNAPAGGADIFAVQVNMLSRKTDAGSAGLKAVTRISGVDYPGTEVFPSSSYSDRRQIWDLKPDGSAAVWTSSDFNAAEFGYEKSS